MKRALATLLSFVLLLSGCAQQPVDAGTQYYLLSSNTESYAKNKTQFSLTVMPVTVATYINTPGIALQTHSHHIRIANHHLWAEKPEQSITRVLHSELDRQLLNYRVDNGRFGLQNPRDWGLNTQIDQFHGTEDGFAMLSGYWQLKQQGKVWATQRFNYKTALPQPGYSALVGELRGLLTQLAEAQVAAIEKSNQ